MQDKVTDEMIARHLSGKATPEEEAVVLNYLSENDEHLDDYLAMTASIEAFGPTSKKNDKPSKVIPLWSVYSAAACVVILIVVSIALWYKSPTGNEIGIESAPPYAAHDSIDDTLQNEGQISVSVKYMEDTL